MKKTILSAVMAFGVLTTGLLSSIPAHAGGYLTNTNQSISFLRMPAQNAVISVNGAYFNPAGVGFLSNGWHTSFGWQVIHQTREITSTFTPFKDGIYNDGKDQKKFKGLTNVPFLPSLDLAYVHGKFFGSFHFGVVGGGGKADFKDGLGSFEGQIAGLHTVANMLTQQIAGKKVFNGYGAKIGVLGEQYYFGGQLNLGYRINEHLSVSAGARLLYVNAKSDGSLRDIQLRMGNAVMPASDAIMLALKGAAAQNPMLGNYINKQFLAMADAKLKALTSDKALKCTQHDWTIAPILGIDYKIGKFNFAAKYEFKTVVSLQNETDRNDVNIPMYADGERFRNDIPAMLSVGAQYTPIEKLRLNIGYNHYFDKQCKQFNSLTLKNDKQDNLKSNPHEFIFGAEYDINKIYTISGGVQKTIFGFGKDGAYISDMNYSIGSWTAGIGGRININDRMSVDIAYFHTFYESFTKDMADYNGIGAGYASKLTAAMNSPQFKGFIAAHPELGPVLQSPKVQQMIAQASQLKLPGKDKYFRTSHVFGVGFNYKF